MAKPKGNKPSLRTPEVMQAAIEQYFSDCQGDLLRDEDGNLMLDKAGMPICVGNRPPTVSGLSLALGFASRQALLQYRARGKLAEMVARAVTRCEAYTEEQLYDREGIRGAEFSLRHNFRWGEADAAENDLQQVAKLLGGVYRAAQS